MPRRLARAAILPLVTTWALAGSDQVNDLNAITVGQGQVSDELRVEKQRDLRQRGWSWTVSATAFGGYTSNIYAGPSPSEVDSALVGGAAKVETVHRLTPADRLSVSLEADGLHAVEDSAVDQLSQELQLGWKHRFSPEWFSEVDARVHHENDHAVSAFGTPLTRDYGYLMYEGGASISVAAGANDTVRFGGIATRRDYDETPGLTTLDWTKLGGIARWTHRGAASRFRLWYEYALKDYDEELATTAGGAQLAGNPSDLADLHDLLIWWTRDFSQRTAMDVKLDLSLKDDRFEGYESYRQARGELGFDQRIGSRFDAQTSVFASWRTYPVREVVSGDKLSFMRYGGDLKLTYQMSRHWAAQADYSLAIRDSNKDTGTTYRDYLIHTGTLGVTAAF